MSEELVEPSENQNQEICYDPTPVDTKQVTVAELIKRNQQDPQRTPSKPGMHRRAFDDDL